MGLTEVTGLQYAISSPDTQCYQRHPELLTTLSKGLVRPVPAVTLLVTHLLHADTLPTAALEPGRGHTVGDWQ